MEAFKEAMEKINKILKTVIDNPSNINYWGCYKKIKSIDLSNILIPENTKIKIALLSSFTIEPLAVYLDIECRKLKFFPEIYIAGFNQFRQEILDSESPIYHFKPNITILATNLENFLGEFEIDFFNISIEEKHSLIESVLIELKNLTTFFKANSSGILIINNFIEPVFSPYGIIDNKQELGLREFYQIINLRLINAYKNDDTIYIFDIDKVASNFGLKNIKNHKIFYLSSIEYSELFLPHLVEEYISFIKANKGMTKKCIVLDLDNTLWGGIIGEDGFNGIKLNNSNPGNQFVDFQKSLLKINKRGILLAINSKNNYEDAINVIRNHPFMVLREKNFSSIMINWDEKVKNLIKISEALGIGLDSFVFFDDNPIERDRVKQALPEVLVVDLPTSASLYKKILEELKIFDLLSITQEDKDRIKMYESRQKRKELEQSIQDYDQFLETLDIHVKVENINDFTLPRISNLILKTNQFNLTTKRYSKADIIEMASNPDIKLYSLSVKDRFGDEGIVGSSIIIKQGNIGMIDAFLMSCRVIGRKIENAFLSKIIKDQQVNGVDKIKGIYLKTDKNDLVKNFYRENGFVLMKEDEKGSEWLLDFKNFNIKIPKFIHIEE